MTDDSVLFARAGVGATITLNRPAALNALTLDMCLAMDEKLRQWAVDDSVRVVLIRQTGDRAFCAGGDIRKMAAEGPPYQLRFWFAEYRLNTLIKHYPKPFVALIDGIAMGGGVGVSAHGSHRVVSEHLRFAMPETDIGVFPDTGGSYVLSRMPGEVGMYLGLTGAHLGVADALYCGYATHHVPKNRFSELEAALTGGADVDDALRRVAQDAGPAPLARRRSSIDAAFAGDSVEVIMSALEADPSAFARETRQGLEKKSPFSLKLTFRELREARHLDFDDCMRMEWRMMSRIPDTHDFYEGVRALLIDKDKMPRWQPASLAGITKERIDRHFEPRAEGELLLDPAPVSA